MQENVSRGEGTQRNGSDSVALTPSAAADHCSFIIKSVAGPGVFGGKRALASVLLCIPLAVWL